MDNHKKIILSATCFNLLFEYSMRGVNNIRINPLLPLILFFTYFILFTMVEDLLVRFRLGAYQLIILAFSYGAIYDAWVSGVVFSQPGWYGINWRNLILVGTVWWGAIQAVLTFYLANRLFPRDWNHRRLSGVGWALCLFSQFLIIGVFQASGKLPQGTPVGKRTIILLFIIGITLFFATIRSRKNVSPSFLPSRFLDWLSAATCFIFLFSALFLGKNPSDTQAS